MVKTWEKEADLCRDFSAWVIDQGWLVYAETGGWDLLLVRPRDGFQVGIEAKLSLNAKVLCQVLDSEDGYIGGPDVHAVLVPEITTVNGLVKIARRLNIVVFEGVHTTKQAWRGGSFVDIPITTFRPDLPRTDHWNQNEYASYGIFPERCPDKRLELPDYVPDVTGGHSAPVQLTTWKIGAIKIAIIMDRLGCVTRGDFKALKVSPTRWTVDWLKSNGNGGWVPGGRADMPDFKAQHPVNYAQIEADWPQWSRTLPARLVD